MKKVICLLLVVICFMGCFVGCGSDSSNNSGDKKTVTNSDQAIAAVKNNLKGSAFSTEQRIASALGFNNFSEPRYGANTATQKQDGSWDVTLKGSMSGYVDDYHSDFKTFQFELKATVSETGDVTIKSTKKV